MRALQLPRKIVRSGHGRNIVRACFPPCSFVIWRRVGTVVDRTSVCGSSTSLVRPAVG